MNIGDWVFCKVGEETALGYITGLPHSNGQVYVTRVAKRVNDTLVWMKPESRIYDQNKTAVIDNTLAKEDYQDLIDLAIKTGDRQWFFELRERMLQDV
ncbi:hypothetical protein [Domibacillus aminovorans]|uniref:IDEAL domain-containing protein n=1 Tax=Domibacillus aminovorans TaxID=29332 RepID=A0A177L5B8_9BACI|nr:hypothetical protein [Domibacillus aminovorans]OAH60495.1 hypothetical protein AWH49_16680 [Domibacillus aminovorans]